MAVNAESQWASHQRSKIRANNRFIQIVAPSIVAPSEKFSIRISIVGPDQMPIDESVVLNFSDAAQWTGLDSAIKVDGEPAQLEGISLAEPGVYRLETIFGTEPYERLPSNPVLVQPEPKQRLFFGDLHIHSVDGLCQAHAAKSPKFAFDYIRNVSFLDFAAITDHVRGLDADKWNRQKRLVAEYDNSGVFVPFLGFESSHKSGQGGDNNGYFSEAQGDYFWLDRADMAGNAPEVPLTELWKFLAGAPCESMTIPHHTGRYRKYRSWDEPYYNPEQEWLFEVCSQWGSSEERHSRYPLHAMNTDKPAYFQDAIKAGCRFGLIGSTDDHTTLPGIASELGPPGSPRWSFYGRKCLAAVFADKLDRYSLWQSFKARRTYATNFDRSILFFESDGTEAGSSLAVSPGSANKRRLSVRLIPAVPWYASGVFVTLLRNGSVLRVWGPIRQTDPIELEYIDDEAFDSACLRGARHHKAPFIAYYVRADYMLGGTVWSSPIWFDHP